ncbi:ATP-binding protein [Palleronia abyssalis]|uniref:histidine kinase n=1 Tax=Palleronia abyssalis TaxID=1501240 RepID=A0A2R8C205_9RHOB|nr:ATP-binding protein [Palleronia abyssalis]SPJ26457.1 Sensory/regulatory protein RpfC [Palleronia abyssalis]
MLTISYLRARLLAALALTVAASFFGWFVDKSQLSHLRSKSELSETFADALHTMTDALIALHAIRSAPTQAIGEVSKDGLAGYRADLISTQKDIVVGGKTLVLAPESRELLDREVLDPIGLMIAFADLLEAVSGNDALWGSDAERHVAMASAITSELLPIVRRISHLESEHLTEKLARHQLWLVANLGLVTALTFAIWGIIFRPMEREIMRSQDEVRRRMEQARAASRAKSDFLAMMSHEIRTPLNGILGLTERLGTTSLEPEQEEIVGDLGSSGTALLTIIEDVLEISSIEAGKFKIEPRSINLREELKHIHSMFRYRAESQGLALTFEVEERVAPLHVTDPGRVRQILVNLVSNAIKFTEHGTISVRLQVIEASDDAQKLTFEVEDTGIGISADHLERVFHAFEQVDTSLTRRFGGTGLGLAISRRISEALGGELTVNSSVGRGSCFRLKLNLPMPILETTSETVAPSTNAIDISGARVLAAEDNRVNRKILEAILVRSGCNITFAEDGEQAIECAASGVFDIILMDLSMPGTDGFSAARAIQECAAERGLAPIPIVALTAHVGDAYIERCLAAGMKGLLGKPFRSEEIVQAIATYMTENRKIYP